MWYWLVSVALAGTVYVNDVDVSALRNTTLKNVTVQFDDKGDVHITAPQYEIQVVQPDGKSSETTTATAAGTTPQPETTPPEPSGNGIPKGHWWAVTEDDGSQGHTVDVFVNGTQVLEVHSGDAQKIQDIGPYLKPGANQVTMRSTSQDASGGAMYVYVGTGSNDDGTLMMDTPKVQFGLGPTRSGPYERKYTVQVAP